MSASFEDFTIDKDMPEKIKEKKIKENAYYDYELYKYLMKTLEKEKDTNVKSSSFE